jgi:hypothetical protein
MVVKAGAGTIADMKKKLLDAVTPDLGKAVESYTTLVSKANEFNNALGNNRARIIELQQAMGETLPMISRLGGDIGDVGDTMSKIAESSRRSVIANSEDVAKLYAATKVLGVDAKVVADDFLDVGVGIEQIPKHIEASMQYVQSIGGNTVQVFKSVEQNMSQLNRYQFEGGVQGLTKMAAQASMLRFNMNETFQLAEKVLTPEGAIETASAFQRLGVSVGALADPFALMNQSINDPSGLQDSLVSVAKQFTYFDEKTKTFKINPQGVLTLKEMQQQTGVSAAEMTKLGLAAAEAEKRMSEISPSITFKNEEDKQYLSNISKMSENGKYQVEVTDEKGKQSFKDLADVTQDEMDKLIQRQKDQPKTLEEVARSQMDLTKIANADLQSIKDRTLMSVITSGGILKVGEDIRTLVSSVGGKGSSSETGTVRGIREKYTEPFSDKILNVLMQMKDGKMPAAKDMKELMDGLKGGVTAAGVATTESIRKGSKEAKPLMLSNPGRYLAEGGEKFGEQGTNFINKIGGNFGGNNYGATPIDPNTSQTQTLTGQQPVQPRQTNKT